MTIRFSSWQFVTSRSAVVPRFVFSWVINAHKAKAKAKAKAIAEETSVLDDAQIAAAEELILAVGLAGKAPGQIGRLAARAVVTVDPDGARRREQAEKEDARIRFWREHAGS